MPTTSTRLNISTKPSSHPDNNDTMKKSHVYLQNTKDLDKPMKKWIGNKFGHDNKQQINKNHLSKKYDNKNYNNSRSAKIRTPILRSNLTSAVTDVRNTSGKVLATNCVNLHNYVESPTSSTSCYSQSQYYRGTLYSSNTNHSSTSTQSSCVSDQSDQEFYDAYNSGSQHAAKENVGRIIPQRWVTSLYDIYLVTQKFNPSENMHQNYLDTVGYAILAIWDTSYDSEVHNWIQQVLQRSGTNCRIIELTLYYLLRFKRCLNRSKVELSYIINYSKFTVSTEPCPKSQESVEPFPALISSLIIAWKFFQDENYRTNHWTFFTGYTIEQLNVFERDFLRMIDYNVFIKENSFKQWLRFLHSHMQAICGPGLDIKFAYFLPQNRERINEFIKSMKMLNIEEMERIIRVNERHIGRGKENERVRILNLEDIKHIMERS